MGNNITTTITTIFLGAYKDSTLLGAYYGPLPTPSGPSSLSVFMLQASQATRKQPNTSFE